MADRGIGLDLGTSKISVCINNKDRIEKLPIGNLNKEYPCCIYYNNKVLFGEEAVIKGRSAPEYCFKHLKTLIGRLYSDEYVQYMKDHMCYKIVAGENDRVMVEVRENNQIVHKDPTELLSMLVNHVIEDVQSHIGNKRIEYLALAYPPSFNDSQKTELKRIGILTGIRHIDLYAETTATCIYYGFTSMVPGQTVMIVDCGAGTCDATILKYEDGFEVVGHAGKDTIGGDRYSQELMSFVLKQYKDDGAPINKLNNKKKGKLEDAVENGKIALRTCRSVDIDIEDEHFQPVSITQPKLNLLSNVLNKEIVAMVKELIASTGCEPNNIILSGKGMLLTSLANMICKEVGLEDMAMNIDEPVAHGLAMYLNEIIKNHKEDDHCNEIRRFGDYDVEPNLTESFPPIPGFPETQIDSQTPFQEFPGVSIPISMDCPAPIGSTFPEMPFQFSMSDSNGESSLHPSFPIPEDVPPPVPVDNPNIQEPDDILKTINPYDIPDLEESLINQTIPNGFHITEKRAFDLSIGIAPKATTDRVLLVERKEPLPCVKKRQLKVLKGKVPQFSLYEGNSPWKKNNTRIRHTILERDNEHPDTSDYKFNLMLEVDEAGFISTSFEWDDTGKPIRVVEDKELTKHTVIHKPKAIERPIQQNDQAFTDVDTCKEAIKKVVTQLKGELKKMKPKDKEVIEDSIRDVETLLPLQDSLDKLNEMYQNIEDVMKKAESIINAPTRTREMELEYSVCYKDIK